MIRKLVIASGVAVLSRRHRRVTALPAAAASNPVAVTVIRNAIWNGHLASDPRSRVHRGERSWTPAEAHLHLRRRPGWGESGLPGRPRRGGHRRAADHPRPEHRAAVSAGTRPSATWSTGGRSRRLRHLGGHPRRLLRVLQRHLPAGEHLPGARGRHDRRADQCTGPVHRQHVRDEPGGPRGVRRRVDLGAAAARPVRLPSLVPRPSALPEDGRDDGEGSQRDSPLADFHTVTFTDVRYYDMGGMTSGVRDAGTATGSAETSIQTRPAQLDCEPGGPLFALLHLRCNCGNAGKQLAPLWLIMTTTR